MVTQLYRDPTLEAAQRMEIREKGCRICQRRTVLACGAVRCMVGKRFPACRGERKGFVLEVRYTVAANA